MKSKINYSKKIADNFHDIRYYECIKNYRNNYEEIEKEKIERKTKNKEKVTETITEYKDKEKTWEIMAALRNRKRLSVYKECHINLIHKGKYGGTRLNALAPKILYDNRILTYESYVHKGNSEPSDYKKTLENKGWKKETNP